VANGIAFPQGHWMWGSGPQRRSRGVFEREISWLLKLDASCVGQGLCRRCRDPAGLVWGTSNFDDVFYVSPATKRVNIERPTEDVNVKIPNLKHHILYSTIQLSWIEMSRRHDIFFRSENEKNSGQGEGIF